jgi:hypothetical protein
MSLSRAPNQTEQLLQGLAASEAKQREAAAKRIAQQKPSDERIVSQLQNLAASDPYAYVREAASVALLALGQTVPAAIAPPQVGPQRYTAIIIIAIIAIPLIIVFVACVVIAILVVVGPEIGSVFSRVTNGLQ